ncbi:MAG: cation transporter [Anaerolineaceae bacterium]|nr:cation transporter [Anaerolineaceae bacterium]
MKALFSETPPRARFAWLSIGAAVTTIGLKTAAYLLTGSVGLLSDALESGVNLAGAIMALIMLTIAVRPADEEHAFGHSKAEYFSSGIEGTLILVAAVGIIYAAIGRLITPRPLEQLGTGLLISAAASLVNLGVSMVLLRAARQYHSITLDANAQHLLTDVWTSAGVLVGVGAVSLTGWQALDPIAALVVAGNIIYFGVRIVRQSVLGLMDAALPPEEQEIIHNMLARYQKEGVEYHAVRTRRAGAQRFVTLHVLTPGDWTVHKGHNLLESIEADIRAALPNTIVFTHLEALEDPASWDDIELPPLKDPAPQTPGEKAPPVS